MTKAVMLSSEYMDGVKNTGRRRHTLMPKKAVLMAKKAVLMPD